MRFFLLFLALYLSACTINVPESTFGDDQTDAGGGTDTETTGTEGPDLGETSEVSTMEDRETRAPNPMSYDTVCRSAIPAGAMDVAIQKAGHFYETAGKIVLHARTKLSPGEDTAERLMYGDQLRMWVRVPEVIRTVQGRGSHEAELCLTVGNVNCRYIWGAKVFELDMCDFGVQPDDVLGARFFSLEVHNSDLAPDAMVRAELKAVSPVR